MIFNSSDEVVAYLNKLIHLNVAVSLLDLNKILDFNSIVVDTTQLVEGVDGEVVLKSIEKDEDAKIKVTLYSPSWIKMLPSLYHDNLFLQRFLFGFQTADLKHQNIINTIEEQFSPSNTNFIDWLSTWVGIRFAAEVNDRAKRRILHNIVRLYKIRGTKAYFIELIGYLTGVDVRIEDKNTIEVLHGSLIRRNNADGSPFFLILIDEKLSSDENEEQEILQMIHDIVDAEKPINVTFRVQYPFGKTQVQARQSSVVDMHYENYYDYDNFRD